MREIIKTTKKFDKVFRLVHLDGEILSEDLKYPYFIVTQKEMRLLKKKTHKRIKLYNKIKPKSEAGFVER